MQSKFEKFNELPAELKIEIAQNLSNRDLVNLAQTSKYHLALFQPLLDVRKLLHYVARGDHKAVEAMLKKDMSLIFKRGVVTDCSGREFENVSPFEYALWALDKHMWAAMIACIPQNEEGRKVFAQLIAQYNKVNTDGVTYKLNGQTITEKHFDFNNTIIKELQTQVDSLNAPGLRIGMPLRNNGEKVLVLHKISFLCMLSMSIALMNLFILCRSLPHSRSHQNNSIIGLLKRMKIGLMLILSCRLILQYIPIAIESSGKFFRNGLQLLP